MKAPMYPLSQGSLVIYQHQKPLAKFKIDISALRQSQTPLQMVILGHELFISFHPTQGLLVKTKTHEQHPILERPLCIEDGYSFGFEWAPPSSFQSTSLDATQTRSLLLDTHALNQSSLPAIDYTLIENKPKPGKEKIRHALNKHQFSLGTKPDNDIVVDSPYASSFHCLIYKQGTQWMIRDLNSKNGTWLQGVRVHESPLLPAVVIRLGDVEYVFESQPKTQTKTSLLEEEALIIKGQSQVIKKLREQVHKFAETQLPVLILGESGTGKELVAQSLHDQSTRRKGPYVVLNCGALAENLIESELFGHQKGAFTGAYEKRAGAFVQADQGTLFLDEIGELPLDLQPKLLRVLENQEIKALGDDKTKKVDVRVICATHRDLKQRVKEGLFREDLYHRLSVLTLKVPPLREREEDVIYLAEYFLKTSLPEGRHLQFSLASIAFLKQYPFTGNVRELKNAVLRGMILAEGAWIEQQDLGLTLDHVNPIQAAVSTGMPVSLPVPAAPLAPVSLEQAEKETIRQALKESAGSMSQAAKKLGIARSTLYRKVEQYQLFKIS